MTFKASVVGALASVLAFGAASAADLPSMKAPPAYVPPPPVWNWTGWHIGVSGSYGGGSTSADSSLWFFAPTFATFNVNSSNGTSGFLVGGQTGYTWQFANNFVVGYESELNYADVRSNIDPFVGGQRTRIDVMGGERLRFGYAMGRLLPYITGGLSYGRFRTDGGNAFGGLLLPRQGSAWHAGWSVGAGVEYAIWDKLSVKAEYLFSSIDGPSGASLGFPANYTTFRVRNFDTHIARIGVNYQIRNFGEFFGMPGLGI